MDEELNSIEFEIEDDYKTHCGEIYMNIKGLMIFYCTLCGDKFNGFEKYAEHVVNDHKSIAFGYADDASSTECISKNINSPEHCSDETIQLIGSECKDNIIKTDNEALHETEIPIEKLDNQRKSIKKETSTIGVITDFIEINENSASEAEVEQKFSTIDNDAEHSEIRPIRKKTNYFPSSGDVRPFQCNLCETAFKDPSSLSKHKARHRTEKIHPCPECPKMFYTFFDMKKHLVTHAGARPFLCNICGKTLTTSVKLKDHMRRHTNQRDYECPDCKKRFYNSNLLRSHKLVHKNEKSFVCTFCDAKFTFKKGLNNHLKLHENKREYKCDLCEADFNQQAGLFCHKKNKHQIALNL